MDTRIIKTPAEGTKDILFRRMDVNAKDKSEVKYADTIGLVQGKMIEMLCASDIAEKAVGVKVFDVRGSCPQNMIMIAIFGDTSSVQDAIMQIENNGKEGEYHVNG